MQIREAQQEDLPALLELYTHLHDNPFPFIDDKIKLIWEKIMNDKSQHVILGLLDEQNVKPPSSPSVTRDTALSSCVLIIIQNLTHSRRPYALIENVVTHTDFRGQGLASEVLDYAKNLAIQEGCYKIMLMTGSKEDKVHKFYSRAGYNSRDKTAYIQWL